MKGKSALTAISLLLWITILLHLCYVNQAFAEEPMDVSIIQLIANPKDYDGKLVRIVGYVRTRYNRSNDGELFNAIFVSADDAVHQINKNALWLEISRDSKVRVFWDNTLCLLEGVFKADNKGYLSMWSGAIENISRVESLPSSADYWEKLRSLRPSPSM